MFVSPQDSATSPPKLLPISRSNLSRISELDILRDEQHRQPIRLVLFSPDSSTLVCSTLDLLVFWDVERRRKKAQLHTPALHVAYSPDGNTLVITGRDIAFFDARTGKLTNRLKGHSGGTTATAFSPDGALLASGGMDGFVRVGNLNTQRLVRSFEHPAPVRGLAFSPDGDTIATVSWGDSHLPRNISLWSLKTGTKRLEMKCQTEKNVVFSPDGHIIAVDGTLYSAADLQVIHDLHERVVAFHPDGTLIASCRSDYTTVGLWDTATGDKLLVLKGHTEAVWSLAFSPDGKYLASGSGNLDMLGILKQEDSAEGQEKDDKAVHLWGVTEIDPAPTKPLTPTTKPLRRLPR